MDKPRLTVGVLLVAAVCLVLGATGGAVAGSMITGKQIKNGSVTTKDVKNASLKTKDLNAKARSQLKGPRGPAGADGADGADGTNGTDGTDGTDGVSGFLSTFDTDAVSSGGDGSVSESCTGGRTLIGAFGYLNNSVHPVMVLWEDSNTASAYSNNVPAANTLTLRISCANVS